MEVAQKLNQVKRVGYDLSNHIINYTSLQYNMLIFQCHGNGYIW